MGNEDWGELNCNKRVPCWPRNHFALFASDLLFNAEVDATSANAIMSGGFKGRKKGIGLICRTQLSQRPSTFSEAVDEFVKGREENDWDKTYFAFLDADHFNDVDMSVIIGKVNVEGVVEDSIELEAEAAGEHLVRVYVGVETFGKPMKGVCYDIKLGE